MEKAKTQRLKPLLGILGGIGAAAGVRMASMIVEEAQARGAKLDSDFPRFVLYNLPVTDTDETGCKDLGKLEKQIMNGLNWLVRSRAERILIACNTAHLFFESLRFEFSGLIDMVEVAVLKCKHSSVGVLCSQTSKEHKLYSAPLRAREIEVIEPDDHQQKILNAAIAAAMRGSDDILKHTEQVELIIRQMIGSGANSILLGCTELPLCVRLACVDVPVIDAGREAVRHLLN